MPRPDSEGAPRHRLNPFCMRRTDSRARRTTRAFCSSPSFMSTTCSTISATPSISPGTGQAWRNEGAGFFSWGVPGKNWRNVKDLALMRGLPEIRALELRKGSTRKDRVLAIVHCRGIGPSEIHSDLGCQRGGVQGLKARSMVTTLRTGIEVWQTLSSLCQCALSLQHKKKYASAQAH